MVFLMEMLFLSYVNGLCIYPRLFFSSPFNLRLRTQKAQQTSMFYSYIVLLICVNETISLLGKLPYFKIHVNCFMAPDGSPGVNVISKMHVVGEGPGAILSFETFFSFINRLLVTI